MLILVILGPIAARYTEPIARRLANRRQTPATPPAAERLDDPANANTST